jgi:hypothetical protein
MGEPVAEHQILVALAVKEGQMKYAPQGLVWVEVPMPEKLYDWLEAKAESGGGSVPRVAATLLNHWMVEEELGEHE